MMRIISILVIIIIVGCKKNTPAPTTNTNSVSNDSINYIGDTIVIKTGEIKILVDTVAGQNSYKIVLDSVEENRTFYEYCYVSFPGFARVKIKWINKDTANIRLKIFGCDTIGASCNPNTGVDTLGYHFCLIKLSPYPDTSNSSIPLNDYVATLKIEKP